MLFFKEENGRYYRYLEGYMGEVVFHEEITEQEYYKNVLITILTSKH